MTEALYRKYRPQIFEDVVGQEHIERTLKNAIEQDKVSHAYLFTGPRGTGKTTTARLLAKALLCERGPTAEPDGMCEDCRMIANGEHPDVYELDAASRTGVENVREEIIGRVQFAPVRGRYKVYIIDEVHMLSTAAFNALLKTLEEPPSHVVFILATTDSQKVPETIHSRCQRFDFRRIPAETIVSRLGAICMSENVGFEDEALDLIAHRAEGGMRNALTSLEQLIAFGEGSVTLEMAERMLGGVDSGEVANIVRAIGTRDVARCFRWTAEFVETGAELAQFTRDLAEHIRNLYVMSLTDADVALEISDTQRRELVSELPLFGRERLARLLGVLGDLSVELKTSTNLRLSFELALTRMVRPDSDLTLEALAERIEALESGYSAVAHVSSAPVVSSEVPETSSPLADLSVAHEDVKGGLHESAFHEISASQSSASCMAAEIPAPPQSGQAASPDGGVSAVVSAPPLRSAKFTSDSVSDTHVAERTDFSGCSKNNLQNPAALQRVWKSVLAALKKNKAAYGVLFLNTKVVYDVEKHMLIVEFPAENTFAFKAVQKPDIQDAVTAALMQACGEALPFTYVQNGSVQVQNNDAKAAMQVHIGESEAPSASGLASVENGKPALRSASKLYRQTPPDALGVQSSSAQPSSSDISFGDDEQVPYDNGPISYSDERVPSGGSEISVSESFENKPVSLPQKDVVQSKTVADASSESLSLDELQAVLAAGFGGGVIVEEIKE